jgi:hypothetical protein
MPVPEMVYPHHVIRQCTVDATHLDTCPKDWLQSFLFELMSREEREGTEVEDASPGEKRIGRRTAPSRSSLSSAIGATGENIESSFECVRGRIPERLWRVCGSSTGRLQSVSRVAQIMNIDTTAQILILVHKFEY